MREYNRCRTLGCFQGRLLSFALDGRVLEVQLGWADGSFVLERNDSLRTISYPLNEQNRGSTSPRKWDGWYEESSLFSPRIFAHYGWRSRCIADGWSHPAGGGAIDGWRSNRCGQRQGSLWDCGMGMEGSGLLSTAIKLPGVECVAAADLYDGRHDLAKEIVGKPIRTTRRYKELLDAKDIDAILVAVPDHWHKQVVVDPIRGRRRVLREAHVALGSGRPGHGCGAEEERSHCADWGAADQFQGIREGEGVAGAGRDRRFEPD